MKNKKLIYVLIPVVLIIWGQLIYKVITGMSEADIIAEEQPLIEIKNDALEKKQITYEVKANYADPFLKREPKQAQVSTPTSSNSTVVKKDPPKIEPKQVLKWPDIVYKGSIVNTKTEKEVAMVRINNKNKLLSEKDVVDELELLSVTKDSIVVKYKEEVKGFYLKEK